MQFDKITYREVLEKNLRVMDHTAITLCQENNLPIKVINFNEKGNFKRLIMGEEIGSLVC
jgi:uridylate kinase